MLHKESKQTNHKPSKQNYHLGACFVWVKFYAQFKMSVLMRNDNKAGWFELKGPINSLGHSKVSFHRLGKLG